MSKVVERIKVRRAGVKDLDEIFDLHKIFVKKMVSLRPKRYLLRADEKEFFRRKIMKHVKSKKGIVVVAEESEILGFGIGWVEDDVSFVKERKFGHLHEVAVSPRSRNQGVARMIENEIVNFFRKNKVKIVWGIIDTKNIESMEAHEKLGFNTEAYWVAKEIK